MPCIYSKNDYHNECRAEKLVSITILNVIKRKIFSRPPVCPHNYIIRIYQYLQKNKSYWCTTAMAPFPPSCFKLTINAICIGLPASYHKTGFWFVIWDVKDNPGTRTDIFIGMFFNQWTIAASQAVIVITLS